MTTKRTIAWSDPYVHKNVHAIADIKNILSLNGMEEYIPNLMYVPEVPILGIEKTYIIEEVYGVKVARLISPSNE